MSQSIFIQAVGLARSGRKVEARRLLEQLLKADRTNEMAWLWYAECVDTPAERKHALETCMRLNPQAQRARLSLSALRQTGRLASDEGLTIPVFVGEEKKDASAQDAPAQDAYAQNAHAQNARRLEARGLTDEDQWVLSGDSNIFTVSPDHIPPEEFARVKDSTEAFLLKNPDLKPVWSAAKGHTPQVEPGPTAPPEAEPQAKRPAPLKKSNGKTRGAVFTLLLVTLMFALLVGAVIMLQVV